MFNITFTFMLLLMQVLLCHICSLKKQKSLVMVLPVYWDGVQFPTVALFFVATTSNIILFTLDL